MGRSAGQGLQAAAALAAQAAVASGAIAGASALLSSGDAVVQGLDGCCVVARGCRVHGQVSTCA